jgi:hypothetical protein
MTLAGNRAGNGGSIYNTGTLALDRLNISSNTATLGFGGGIYNAGQITINSVTLMGNYANGGAGGNGYDIGGGGGAGLGGAIFAASGIAAITNTTIVGNMAAGGHGGDALMNAGTTNATANGGGNNPGTYIKAGSPNGGFGGGGGGGQRGYFPYYGGNGGLSGGGGGLGPVAGSNAGFGGGDGSGGCTSIFGNAGGGGGGIGAGIFVEGGILELVNCTVTANSALGGGGGQVGAQGCGGNGGQGIAAGVFNYSGSAFLLNSIVAGNSAANSSPDVYGAFLTTGFNLIGNNQGATNLSINDFQNVAANLGAFKNNGGPTFTCVPQQGSLAIGYGTITGAPRADQRGVPRPQAGSCDIGAVQVVAASPYLSGPVSLDASGFVFEAIFDSTNAFRVQASTNMIVWVDVTNYSSGGSQPCLDALATNFNRRFYRAVVP